MTDASQTPISPSPVVADENRAMAIVVYALYLAALASCGLAGIVGVILAYVKRADARGTLWESHFQNQISTFWAWFALFVLGVVTSWILIGIVIIGVAFLWFLYRTVKGLIYALESRPYVG
jgi:uncharacterized membrane protein